MRVLWLLPALLLTAAQDPARAGRTALTKAIKDRYTEGVQEALGQLVKANNDTAVKAITAEAAKLRDLEDPWTVETYWSLLGAAASVTEAEAVGELAKFILRSKSKPISRDAMSAVCNRGHKELIPLCVKLLESGPDDLQALAADHLGAIGDRAAFEALLAALKKNSRDAELKRRIGRALSALTGQSYGDSLTNWEGWWTANQGKDWEEISARSSSSSGDVTDTFDAGRYSEFERLKKTGKVLILKAGDKCQCGQNHDLDNIDEITQGLGLTTETIDKVEFDKAKDKDLDLDQYVALLANCTYVKEHCVCPMCTPSAIKVAGSRAFQ